ncbi:N5-carboxyaminoimidazole ribonucleotide synthase [Agaricicola taiwanensis]|uniref:N5-carboxyaminoimidazole ribonucleotide synthase n=1 Tax=Agaricicola taiwanensis TaxID=591372 RepID=A0A8J2YET8_9RHOB|nr:5-(carboxyamino)imidazole ribonucleotide synthase [Agaricicola taiwanensis]GGE38741.1 N5-carboxyaminoimidazole ribonucleotide synthase [Agaricicola taiwanensis]
MTASPKRLSPGATIGILGGGQLGRMLALAAARLGFRTHIYCPDVKSPAFDVTRDFTIAPYEDESALMLFADSVDVVTYEFENVPARTAAIVARQKPLYPDAKALETTQDRLTEKSWINGLGIPTARFAPVNDRASLAKAVGHVGRPAVLKTRRFGYDGKGQIMLREGLDLDAAWGLIGRQPSILEAFVPFEREVSVVAARGLDGSFAAWDVAENHHENHILKTTSIPARISPDASASAVDCARRIAESLSYVGVLAVEMFVTRNSQGTEEILVNEIAPRVHNSGHWTQDGAVTCQFEQHIRAIAGWPLGGTARRGRTEMTNLIGDEVLDLDRWLEDPRASLHLYGKTEVRAGRKMGHITRVLPEEDAG